MLSFDVYLTGFGYLQILLSPCLFDWIWIPTDSSPPLEADVKKSFELDICVARYSYPNKYLLCLAFSVDKGEPFSACI